MNAWLRVKMARSIGQSSSSPWSWVLNGKNFKHDFRDDCPVIKLISNEKCTNIFNVCSYSVTGCMIDMCSTIWELNTEYSMSCCIRVAYIHHGLVNSLPASVANVNLIEAWIDRTQRFHKGEGSKCRKLMIRVKMYINLSSVFSPFL